jgi:hypothetical protein
MERFHRILSNGNIEFKSFLDQAGIDHKYEESIVGKTVFLLISESNPKWPVLEEAIDSFDVLHSVELKFSMKDIRKAAWCDLGVTSHFGYPQPEADFGYQNVTYVSGSACDTCGVGAVQSSPFRFRKDPSQKRLHLLQLNWVFDAFFASVEARSHIEAAGLVGMTFGPIVLHKTGKVIAKRFQMHVTETLPPVVDTSRLTTELCSECRSSKYNYPTGESLKIAESTTNLKLDIVKTSEWFGSGGSAFRIVLISQRFANLILDQRWRGVSLSPVVVDVEI